MGSCCCKEESDSDAGERDRLLTNPVSDDDDENIRRSSGAAAGGVVSGGSSGSGKADRPDVQAALSQILENVAVQVIDIGQAGPQVVERQEYTQRARQLLRVGSERLRGFQQPKRRLPLLGNGVAGNGPSLADTLGRDSPPTAADVALATELSRSIAEATSSVSVRVPEDLLVRFGGASA